MSDYSVKIENVTYSIDKGSRGITITRQGDNDTYPMVIEDNLSESGHLYSAINVFMHRINELQSKLNSIKREEPLQGISTDLKIKMIELILKS